MQNRTKRAALDIILFCDELPRKNSFFILEKQLMRSASSVASNYRAVSRAKSTADFINKLTIVEEEADESLLWLEMIMELYHKPERVKPLHSEMEEILKIVVASIKTAKAKQNPKSAIDPKSAIPNPK